ncbi:hypothetical protein Sango_1179100 [Sesamum angolense]|uniref:Uncharacterized protein n=1 Tax=Sesamum angolense TaxID=2727404 RepID=A0AAE2BX58_9LAMI|nr:hypothetical protein Sango_1179100 [Sesamum angolense]
MGIDNARLTSVNTSLTSFSGDIVEPLGEIMLLYHWDHAQGEETLKVQQYEPINNNQERQVDLDLVQEHRDNANARVEAYKEMMAKAYNSKVRRSKFQVGDLVLRRAYTTRNLGKLDAKWEGPYQVSKL